MFGPDVNDAARAHAIEAWPKEACGIVVDGVYKRARNTARDPEQTFRMPANTFAMRDVQAVIHSHCEPAHGPWPSAADMRGQLDTAVPWGIVWTDGQTAREPLWLGEHTLDADLLGRPFRPGVYDCYALVRAWYWRELGVKLPEFPRDADWWHAGGNLLADGFEPAGFRAVDDIRVGDVLLMQIRSKVPNHCAVALDNGLMLHHLENRLSAREVMGRFLPFVTHRLRHVG